MPSMLPTYIDYTEYLKAWGDMQSSKDSQAACQLFLERIASKHPVAL